MSVAERRKPVQRRSVATVEFLLDAAAHILERDGLSGYNTNAVSSRAGISIGSLYQYFRHKDEITAALIVRTHSDIASCLEAAIAATDDLSIDRAIEVMLDLMIEAQSKTPRLNRILEIEEERLPRGSELLALERRIEDLNRDFFRRYAAPSISPDELDLAARDIGHIIRALLDAESREGGASGQRMLRDRLVRAVSGYFAPLRAA